MAKFYPFGGSKHTHESKERRKRLVLHESDQQCDVTLVVKDGKQLKAHGNVLSKASPFFENTLNSYWKENRERIIRIELLTEEVMKDILEFIYSGTVDVSSLEMAEDLIAAADYLFLPNLKVIAGRLLEQSLSTSNSILIYQFAERYQCEELLSNAKKFINSNFLSVSKEEVFLNLSSHEIEEWISSDDIHVSAEEDVFNIVMKWIDHNKNERKEKFQDLFRHLRLPFVSHDCLLNEVSTNDLVKQDEVCMNWVTGTLSWMSGSTADFEFFSQTPRKALETEALVLFGRNRTTWFYLPDKDKWYTLPAGMSYKPGIIQWMLSSRNKLFFFDVRWSNVGVINGSLWSYYPSLNYWTKLANWKDAVIDNWTIAMGDIWPNFVLAVVLVEEVSAFLIYNLSRRQVLLLKYYLDSDSWEIVPSFDWGRKMEVCVVSADKYIYTFGGWFLAPLNEAARFDVTENKWESVADMHKPRQSASGVAVHEKIYIAGGSDENRQQLQTCEMYIISTDEWQLIADLTISRTVAKMVCADETLYVFGASQSKVIIECYDKEQDKWKQKTIAPIQLQSAGRGEHNWIQIASASSLRIFKGIFNNLQCLPSAEMVRHRCTQPISNSSPVRRERRCSMM